MNMPIFDTYEQEQAWRRRQNQPPAPRRVVPAPIKHTPPGGEVGKTPIQISQPRGGKVGKRFWLVRDFLHRGALVLLAAEAGSGKSTLLYRCAEAITHGQLFLNQLPTVAGRVLVVQGDEPPADAAAKFRLMGIDGGFDVAYVDPPLDMAWLTDQITTDSYEAVFIDSATTLLTSAEREITDQSFSRQLYQLGRLLAQHQVAGIVAAHLNKPADGQIRKTVTKHDVAGVATIAAACSDIWGLWRDPKPEWPDQFNLICLGKRNCPTGSIWKLEGSQEDYSWSLKSVAEGLLPQDHICLQQRILQHLSSSHPQSCTDIAAAVNSSYEPVRRACTEMFAEGLIERHKQQSPTQGRPVWLYAIPK